MARLDTALLKCELCEFLTDMIDRIRMTDGSGLFGITTPGQETH